MNERIKEIAEQCYHPYSEHNINLEKFVELIVQDCIEQIYPQWIKEHKHVDPTNLADAVFRVKEHFGV